MMAQPMIKVEDRTQLHTALTIPQIKAALPALLADTGKERISLCLWGPSGVGKTNLIEQVCQEQNYDCISWMRAATMDLPDVKGIPDITNSGHVLKWFLPSWFPTATSIKTVLFFDDFGQGLPTTQAGLMQLVLEYRTGMAELPDDCSVIAASNRVSDRSGVHQLLAALSLRMTHIDVIPDIESWAHIWAPSHDIDPAIIAFLRARPQFLHDFDPNLRSSPNPRGWERVSRIYRKRFPPEVQLALFCGTVGDGPGFECDVFLNLLKKGLPDLSGILRDPENAKVPRSVDVQFAVASGLSAMATQENFAAVIQFTGRIGAEFQEFAVLSARSRDASLCNTLAYQHWALANQKLHS